MARLKFFPRSRRPSLGELLGINQAARQVSRKHHLRICSIRCRRSRTRSDGQRGACYYSASMLFAPSVPPVPPVPSGQGWRGARGGAWETATA